jgi:hypothetical protein
MPRLPNTAHRNTLELPEVRLAIEFHTPERASISARCILCSHHGKHFRQRVPALGAGTTASPSLGLENCSAHDRRHGKHAAVGDWSEESAFTG